MTYSQSKGECPISKSANSYRHFPSSAPQGGGLQKKMDEALDPRSIDRAGIYLDLTNKTQHLRQVFSPETKYGNGINGWKNWW